MKARGVGGFLPAILRLYIPHGSDERRWIFLQKSLIRLLYIPHGSDESRLRKATAASYM